MGLECIAMIQWHHLEDLMPDLHNLHQATTMMHNRPMRTTVTLADESHEFASYYARVRGLTLSAAIDELIRKAQSAPLPPPPEIRYSPNGLPMFPPSGRNIAAELVRELEEEEFAPEKFT
jgi:hypothetical protein